MIQLIPNGVEIDPITCTWWRGLIATALERGLRPLCWHIEHGDTGTVATGYVTVSLHYQAQEIRRSWAEELKLSEFVDEHGRPGGYSGSVGPLTIALPIGVDPDEHCRVCNRPFDPRDTSADGLNRYQGGDVCCSCATTGDGSGDSS